MSGQPERLIIRRLSNRSNRETGSSVCAHRCLARYLITLRHDGDRHYETRESCRLDCE